MARFTVQRRYDIEIPQEDAVAIEEQFGPIVLRDLLIACTYYADTGDCKSMYLKEYTIGNEAMQIKVGDRTWENEDEFDDVEKTLYVLEDWRYWELGNEVL